MYEKPFDTLSSPATSQGRQLRVLGVQDKHAGIEGAHILDGGFYAWVTGAHRPVENWSG
jgi:hypothetical protein